MAFIESLINGSIPYASILLIVALGGLVSERSGIVNIGLEGLLGFGAFCSAWVVYLLSPLMPGNQMILWIAVAAAMVGSGIFASLHAFACVTMKSNQVISGTVINIVSTAITIFLTETLTHAFFGGAKDTIHVSQFARINIPLLSNIPIVGAFFRNLNPAIILVVVLLVATWFYLYKQKGGLRLRACGENPHAADSMGINVNRVRYKAVILSGMFSGLGGAILVFTTSSSFGPTVFSGMGFLALAALIFGNWQPFKVLGACFFFAVAKIFSIQIGMNGVTISGFLLNALPFVLTLIVLVIFSKNSKPPKASGEIYDKSKR